MKWLVAYVLAGTTIAAAAPDVQPYQWPVKRKPPTEKYSIEMLEVFVSAVVADKAGDPQTARLHYVSIVRKEPRASAAYNLADVSRRVESYTQAIEHYKKYLQLAPDAPDRKEVEQLVERLEKLPPVAVIDGEDPDAVVLVDGKLVGPSPAIVTVEPGPHIADRIGPTSYRHEIFSAFKARTQRVALRYEEATGNVILSTSWAMQLRGTWEDGGHTFRLRERFTLPPGRYETFVKSSQFACNKIAFDVAKGDVVTYVYIDVKPSDDKRYCKPLVATQQTLRFAP